MTRASLTVCLHVLASALSLHAEPDGSTVRIREFRLRSELLSAFWGKDMYLESGVVLPTELVGVRTWPVCYNIHGFGGSHRAAWRAGPALIKKMDEEGYPRMIYVFLNAQFSLGHHEFADSVNNGPWGEALVNELIPALERELGGDGRPAARFLTGHSSGGWSSLWLQVNYPDIFGGTWSTSPDSSDFRDFTGVNVYEDRNAYVDGNDKEIPLVRDNGQWVGTIKKYVENELKEGDHGGQFASFDAVFSPRGEDGRPMPLFDRKTGAIDPRVARAWEKYDISLILRQRWDTLRDRLRGKLRVYCGLQDTFRLEGAAKLLKGELEKLGSDAQVILVEGRDHGSLFAPHSDLWPRGLVEQIHREMLRRYEFLGWD